MHNLHWLPTDCFLPHTFRPETRAIPSESKNPFDALPHSIGNVALLKGSFCTG